MEEIFRCPVCKTVAVTLTPFSCQQCNKTFSIQNNIYQFVQDKDTETWDHYWKRIPVYDNILDVLRKIMNVQLRRYAMKFLHSQAYTLEPGGGSAYVSAMLAERGMNAYAM